MEIGGGIFKEPCKKIQSEVILQWHEQAVNCPGQVQVCSSI